MKKFPLFVLGCGVFGFRTLVSRALPAIPLGGGIANAAPACIRLAPQSQQSN